MAGRDWFRHLRPSLARFCSNTASSSSAKATATAGAAGQETASAKEISVADFLKSMGKGVEAQAEKVAKEVGPLQTKEDDYALHREVQAKSLEAQDCAVLSRRCSSEEFELIREIVDDYPYLAMDTEFPGVVVRPVGVFKSSADYHYQSLRANVNMLKLVQLGLTFSDENGSLPTCGTNELCVWQFNFREFNLREDVYAQDSIELLHQSGMDFRKNEERGIDINRLGELLMSSGIVMNENLNWVSFLIAGACLLAGSVQNAKHTRFFSSFGTVDLTLL